ncbi:MAG: hypothetical protein VCF07_12240 [Nitrospinota bacterium]
MRIVPPTTSAAPAMRRGVMFSASRMKSQPRGITNKGWVEAIAETRTARV